MKVSPAKKRKTSGSKPYTVQTSPQLFSEHCSFLKHTFIFRDLTKPISEKYSKLVELQSLKIYTYAHMNAKTHMGEGCVNSGNQNFTFLTRNSKKRVVKTNR